jgi:DNA-binding XRE family transcriptional regulator
MTLLLSPLPITTELLMARKKTRIKKCLNTKCKTGCPPHRRGLCWRCYNNKKIRNKFGPVSPMGNKVFNADFEGPELPADVPINAPPKSKAMLFGMLERARRRMDLFHIEDGKGMEETLAIAERMNSRDRLVYMRRRLNLSSSQLAEQAGILESVILLYEKGGTLPDWRAMDKIRKVLGLGV